MQLLHLSGAPVGVNVGRPNQRPRYASTIELIVGGVMHLTAVYRKLAGGCIGFVEELPGANTQGATLDEARANLSGAVELVLEANRTLAEETIQGKASMTLGEQP